MTRLTTISVLCSLLVGGLIGHLATRVGMSGSPAVPLEETRPTISRTRDFAQKIIVPVVDFEAASLDEVVDYLRSMSRTGIEIPGEPAPFRLNFVVADPEKRAKPINLRMKSVQLDHLCERVAQVGGVLVAFDSDAIVFSVGNNRVEQAAPSDGDKPSN